MIQTLQTVTAYIEQRIHLIAAYYFRTTLINQSPQRAIQAADILLALEASHYYLVASLTYINCFVRSKRSENIKDVLTAKAVIKMDALLTMGYCIIAIYTWVITGIKVLICLSTVDTYSGSSACSTPYGKIAAPNTGLIITRIVIN